MQYKTLTILVYFWLHTQNQISILFLFLRIFFPHFWRLKTFKTTSLSSFQFFLISLFDEISPIKESKAGTP
jgi:hypothetical protein